MNTFRTIIVASVVSLAAITQAHALNTRTWVSGTGVDQAGCGPIANPCRTLQYAHDNTSAGGEIDVKDPAGYGNIVITKSISVVNDGVGVAGVLATSGTNAVTIRAASPVTVVLRGLTIEGANQGSNGIEVQTAAQLTVQNCLIQGFVGGTNLVGNGILLDWSTGTMDAVIIDTTVQNNDYIGISAIPGLNGPNQTVAGKITLNRVTSIRNKLGVAFYGDMAYIISGQSLLFSVANSFISHNSDTGLQYSTSSHNPYLANHGYFINNTITENGSGFFFGSGGGGPRGASTIDIVGNNIFLNGTDIPANDSSAVVYSAKNNFLGTGSIATNVVLSGN